MSRITVLGSGAWGTAIALSLAAKPDHQVTLWSHRTATAEALRLSRENHHFLPGFRFPDSLQITGDDASALARAEIVVSVIPSQFLRSTITRLAPHIHSGQIFVSATKGIEDHTFLRMTEVIQSCLGEAGNSIPVGALSGPSFAQEVAAGMPTAVTIAFSESAVAATIQREFSSDTLRLYTNDDVIGVELGGALKNVIAIAAGVLAGLGLGSNSAAGLITRGIAEITRLSIAAGGHRETLAGLSGVGDLVLTCTGSLSRNRTVGFELGQGRSLSEILAGLDGKVAEGIRTTRAALGLAHKLGVEMPITEQMGFILDHGKAPKAVVRELMMRPGRHEED
ncbi:NAD(P)H-dependent glycerol-3-phosphate dehydrogenase [Acidicapsa ligni]|uniref:NAD(P)H-dependent glycerol-3-phosphate dehydrogenase n=1 Tax=Acidicapsa ligni TaxID=542300 RepID=UPI0021DF7273|nr:NAD(P)H-dependent glycerol-3-phosphate dehydrogenase [Acidicapsa ligni]